MREVYHLIKERKMAVALDNEELAGLRNRLKSGEYDGKDIMQAWLAVDELRELRAEVQDAWYAGLDAGREQGKSKDHAQQTAAADAHELWAAAQLAPGEGIEDGVSRIENILHHTTTQLAAMDEAAAIRAFEDHFQADSDDPYFEGELKLWLTAWRKAIATNTG